MYNLQQYSSLSFSHSIIPCRPEVNMCKYVGQDAKFWALVSDCRRSTSSSIVLFCIRTSGSGLPAGKSTSLRSGAVRKCSTRWPVGFQGCHILTGAGIAGSFAASSLRPWPCRERGFGEAAWEPVLMQGTQGTVSGLERP